jgi:hypothetical protein
MITSSFNGSGVQVISPFSNSTEKAVSPAARVHLFREEIPHGVNSY